MLTKIIADQLRSIRFKNDAYAKSRGAPEMLAICCASCNSYIIGYQKDGPGPLIRCYLDRIHHPAEIKDRQYLRFIKKTFPKLTCPHCHEVIGSPIIYKKETRPAYLLRPGFFIIEKIRH